MTGERVMTVRRLATLIGKPIFFKASFDDDIYEVTVTGITCTKNFKTVIHYVINNEDFGHRVHRTQENWRFYETRPDFEGVNNDTRISEDDMGPK